MAGGFTTLFKKFADGINRLTVNYSSNGLDTNGVSAFAPAVTTISADLTPLGYVKTTAAEMNAGINLSTFAPVGATMAILQMETQAARWRDDGVAPTTANGINLPVLQDMVVNGAAEIAALKLINAVAGGMLNMSFYR